MAQRTLDEAARAYITAIRKSYKPKTVNRRITALRSYDRNLLRGYNAPTPLRATPHPLPGGSSDVERMLDAARSEQQRALIALCGLMGLRVSEALAVVPGDFDTSAWTLRIRGKGDKERVVPVTRTAWHHVALAVGEAVLAGTTVVPYKDRFAREIITACGKRAGVGRRVSSHDLRATFATEAYERTKDLRAVQELLGHSNSATTEGYTLVSESAMRRAAEVL